MCGKRPLQYWPRMGKMACIYRTRVDWLVIRPMKCGAATFVLIAGTLVIPAKAADTVRDIFSRESGRVSEWKATWSSSDALSLKDRLDSQIRRVSADDEQPAGARAEARPENSIEKLPVRADAGDDVLSFVGRRATLNGGQSQPAGALGVRWIQISGPQVKEAFTQGPNLVVVPPEPGVYQFLLVVAVGNQISEPDHVTLTAVEIPAELKSKEPEARQPTTARPVSASPGATEAAPKAEPAGEVTVSNEDLMAQLAYRSIQNLPRSPEMAMPLAQLFGDIAGKMPLYASYAEANEELARRIGLLLNDTQADAQAWTTHVFEPLTAALALWTRPSGLDLRDRAHWQLPLTPVQRVAIGDGLQAFARGLRGELRGSVKLEETGTGVSRSAARSEKPETRK